MMTKILRLHRALSTYALAAALAAVPVSLSFAAAPFDGQWSVRITAEDGKCAAGYTVPIRVSDGRVSYTGPFNAVANGKISGNGRLRVSFAHRKDVVNVQGSVKGRVGQGRWLSPTKDCGGTWVARKS